MKIKSILTTFAMSVVLLGCSSQDIPQGYKGRMFNKTGV